MAMELLQAHPALELLPEPSTRAVAIRIRPEAERAVKTGHPWVYRSSVIDSSKQASAGDLAVLFDRKNRFLAVGLYDPDSHIAVRILQALQPARIGREWYRKKIEASLRHRKSLISSKGRRTTGFRILHGENDGMPGLVLDRYDRVLVLKIYTPAWLPQLNDFLGAISDTLNFEHIVLRTGRAAEDDCAGYGLPDGSILSGGPMESLPVFEENGLLFEADPIHGQKTGFFLDQRENRARVENYVKNAAVLNLFSYTGGFSVYAARGGAQSIVEIDTCAEAVEASQRNMDLNRSSGWISAQLDHTGFQEDVYTALTSFAVDERKFDVVIADPPAFARNREQVDHALEMYGRLTRSCLRVLRPGGLLVQSSCSNPVPEAAFYETIAAAFATARRPMHEIERTSHPIDHPVSFPGGQYLKCLFARAG